MERIIGAVHALLDATSFDDIPIHAIVKRARTSVGAFYARFPDKESLLEHLAVVFTDEAAGEANTFAVETAWRDKPLEKLLEDAVDRVVQLHRRYRGVLRAVVLRSMSARGSSQITQAVKAAGPPAILIDEIKKRRGEINHPNPETALALGMAMVTSATRERILFPELNPSTTGDVPITDAVLSAELTRSLIEFLGVNTARGRG